MSDNGYGWGQGPGPYGQYQQNGYGAPQGPGGFGQPPQGQPPYGQGPKPFYAESCLAAGWKDLTAVPGWLGTMLLLGLINCVPILNFVVMGYALNWSREVPYGGRTPLPKKYVTGRNFEMGFYYLVLSLIVGIVSGIVGAVLGLIPVIGAILVIAVDIAVCPVMAIMSFRMAMAGRFGPAFALSDEWTMVKRGPGQLLAVGILPMLVVYLVAVVVVMIGVVLVLPGIAPAILGASSGSVSALVAGFGAAGMLGLIVMVVCWVIYSMLACICYVWLTRAMGHWTARYAPEWTMLGAAPGVDPYTGQPY